MIIKRTLKRAIAALLVNALIVFMIKTGTFYIPTKTVLLMRLNIKKQFIMGTMTSVFRILIIKITAKPMLPIVFNTLPMVTNQSATI